MTSSTRFMNTLAAGGILIAALVGPAAAQNSALLLYGDSGHKQFLGCLNCGTYDASSVCNSYGEFGSKYQSNSIWNPYGTYGSKFSGSSPWNKYASQAPAIVDQAGNFYGYLSANPYIHNRTTIKGLVALTDAFEKLDDLEKLSDAFCKR